jgi:Domain of unknown function (DUF4124)
MKTRILVLASCLLAFASQAQESRKELWTWRDANGVVHFSDTPGPGATRVDLVVPGAPSGGATAPAPATASAVAKPPAAPGTTYNRLEIWQPENGASFFEADATVSVRLRSDPAVAEGHSLRLYLDGKLVEGAENTLDYTLASLERGAHSITATISDAQGNEKIRSQPVVFHLKQNTIIAPRAVGPNLRPPPRPTPRGG